MKELKMARAAMRGRASGRNGKSADNSEAYRPSRHLLALSRIGIRAR